MALLESSLVVLLIVGLAGAILSVGFVLQLRRQVQAAWAETGRVHQQSTARFVAVGDLIDDVLLETDDHHAITYTNRAFHDLTGFRLRDLRGGLSLTDVLDVDDHLQEVLTRTDDSQAVRVHRSSVRCRDGTRRPVSVRMTAIAEQDRVTGWRCLLEPTEETATPTVEGLLNDILRDFNSTPRDDHLGAVHRALALVGRHLQVDRCYHYAVSEDGLSLESFSQWYAPGVSAMSGDRMLPPLTEFPWALARLREDGGLAINDISELPAEMVPEAARWRAQGLTGLLVAPLRRGNDIVGIFGCETLGRARQWETSDRQLVESMALICQRVQNHFRTAARLAEANERAADLVELLPEPVTVVDADGRIVAWNEALAELSGIPSKEAIGTAIVETVNRSLVGGGDWLADQLADQQEKPTASDFFPLGDRWVQLSRRPLKNREILIHVCDVTSMGDRQVARAIDHQRKVAVASMASGLAQELNAVIGDGLTSAGELLEWASKLDRDYANGIMTRRQFEQFLDASRDTAALIVDNLQRASDVVTGMRQAADDHVAARKRHLGLKDYLGDVLRSLGPRLRERHVDIVFECPDDLSIVADPGCLYRVISNLVTNALQHGFDGMLVGEIRLVVTRDPSRVIIEFSDNGRGMTGEQLERLYDPFYTTARQSGGVGLGLHIVYSLVTRSMGGSITCRSRSGSGTTFRIEVPATDDRIADEGRQATA